MQRPMDRAALLAAMLRERFGTMAEVKAVQPTPTEVQNQASRRAELASDWGKTREQRRGRP